MVEKKDIDWNLIKKIGDNFEFIKKIGSGGMAQIYLFKNKINNRKEAFKILEASFQNDIVKRKRFTEEIRLLNAIDCPYVVKYYGGEIKDDICYIRMEYVDGVILKDYIAKRSRLTVDETVEFASQLALGFEEIHDHNIIHRDIKSQNILITNQGRIKIIDFGIALDDETIRVTKTDMLIGSPQYVSPELIKQDKPTVASDIYAFGVMMYEMLTGKVPFTSKKVLEILEMHKEGKFPRIATVFQNVPIALENIIIKATSKNQSYRYSSMYEIYKDLQECLKKSHANDKLLIPGNKKKMTFQEMINSKTFLAILITLVVVIVVAIIMVMIVSL